MRQLRTTTLPLLTARDRDSYIFIIYSCPDFCPDFEKQRFYGVSRFLGQKGQIRALSLCPKLKVRFRTGTNTVFVPLSLS